MDRGMTEGNRKHNKKEKAKTAGHVYLVGAGPGRRDLITVAGLRLLRRCDTVVYDRLSGEELLAEVTKDCERIYVGKQAGSHGWKQEEINRLLVERALAGRQVVRLKGGDPFVFGRGGEEAECLMAAHIPFSLVPGVSSAVAVPELAGIPVTHRQISRSFHVITGHTADGGEREQEESLRRQIGNLKEAEGTLVFLMGLNALPMICRLLVESGRAPDLPAAVIANGSRYDERIIRGTLSDIGENVRRARVASPAMIVFGETAALSLRCESRLPLEGVRVGLVGTRHLTEKFTGLFGEAGAETLWVQPIMTEMEEEAVSGLEWPDGFTWAVFTSANGAAYFFRLLTERHWDVRLLAHLRIAVIGSGTAKVFEERGIYPDLIPEVFTAQHLAQALLSRLQAGCDKVLLWQAREGNPVLEDRLLEAGIETVRIHAYRTLAGACCSSGQLRTLSYLVFASTSGVTAFCRENPHIFETEVLQGVTVCAIGALTARALAEAGCQACLIPQTFTARGLTEAVIRDRLGLREGQSLTGRGLSYTERTMRYEEDEKAAQQRSHQESGAGDKT